MCWTYSASRVALPRQRTSTPVASGSSVPVWPMRVRRGNQRRTRSTTVREVRAGGLIENKQTLDLWNVHDSSIPWTEANRLGLNEISLEI